MEELIEEARKRILSSKRLVALTGAGISAESGVPTFRGKGGIWQRYRVTDLATPHAFAKDPRLVWEFYNWRRDLISKVTYNPAHKALVDLEKIVPHFALITQNIDDLHRKAGSKNLIELHGNIWWVKCSKCDYKAKDKRVPIPFPPICPKCGGMLRPDIVWFGEFLDMDILNMAVSEVERADTILVVGTSAVVQPAASLIGIGKKSGAFLIEVNLEPTEATPIFDISIRGRAGEILLRFI